MSGAAATATSRPSSRGPGRPPSDAPHRILAAAYEVLKRDGYAGLTTAKVAAASGQNKALISYYYGSKRGLVAAVARHVSETLVDEVLAGLGEPADAEQLVAAVTAGIWRVMDRDEGLQRVYFDLVSQSVVEPEVGEIMREMKRSYRDTLRRLLGEIPDGPPRAKLDAAVVFLIAGLEGLVLERLERGETAELAGARELFERSAAAAIRKPAANR